MKKVLFILTVVFCLSFTTIEEECPDNSTLISTSCNQTGTCWTVATPSMFFPYVTFSAPTIADEADIRVTLEARCGRVNSETYLDPIAL